MGFEKLKRPILAPGLQARSGSASTSPGTLDNDIVAGQDIRAGNTITGVGALAAASLASSGAFKLPVEAITLSSAAQSISRNGVSFVTYGTSGKPSDAILQAPSAAGQVKFIFLTNNTTSIEANINTNATANTFWGTTFNTAILAAASTGSPGGTPAGTVALTLVAQSTTRWAIFPGSTVDWDFSASTGSTATA